MISSCVDKLFECDKVQFNLSTKKHLDSDLKIIEIVAKMLSTTFEKIVDRLNPTRIRLHCSNAIVSVKIKDLARALELSVFEVILVRMNLRIALKISAFAKKISSLSLNQETSFDEFVNKRIYSLHSENLINQFVQHICKKRGNSSKDPGYAVKISKREFSFLPHSYLALPISREKYQIFQKIKGTNGKDALLGNGTFKIVKKARDIGDNRTVAIAIPKEHIDEIENPRQKFEEEIQVHNKLIDVPHVVQGKRIFWSSVKSKQEKIGFMMQEYQCMINAAGNLSQKQNTTVALHIAYAVKALFDKHLYHFDIKPGNIFVEIFPNDGVEGYLGDLGGVREFSSALSDVWSSFKGIFGVREDKNNINQKGVEYTDAYTAPEMISSLEKRDAAIIYDEKKLQKAIIYSLGKTCGEWLGEGQAKEIFLKAIQTNPNDRPSIQEIISFLEAQ